METKQPVTVTDHVLNSADDAFWAAVVAAFPGVQSGDFPPDATHLFSEQQRAAVDLWLKLNHPANSDALWAREFGPAYLVPAAITNALPDMSWHNDTCPSFGFYSTKDDDERAVRLWVEHPDKEQRESSESRFCVIIYGRTGDTFKGYEGDDQADALRIALMASDLLGIDGEGK